jgi:hypothetical protein
MCIAAGGFVGSLDGMRGDVAIEMVWSDENGRPLIAEVIQNENNDVVSVTLAVVLDVAQLAGATVKCGSR